MKNRFQILLRYIMLVAIGLSNAFLFQNCSNWQGDVSLVQKLDANKETQDDGDLSSQLVPPLGSENSDSIALPSEPPSAPAPVVVECDAHTESIKLGCPEGMTGTKEKVCENGKYQLVDHCLAITCKTPNSELIGLGQTVSMDCMAPMQGKTIFTCMGPDMLKETSNNCVDPKTGWICESGETKAIPCNTYFDKTNLVGSVLQTCGVDHKSWEVPADAKALFCSEIRCKNSPETGETSLGGTRESACPTGMYGKNTDVCTLKGDGQSAEFIRSSALSSCLPITCSYGEKILGYQERLTLTSCPEKDYVGTQVYRCEDKDSKGLLILESNTCAKPKAFCDKDTKPLVSGLCSLKLGSAYTGYIKLRCNESGTALDVEDITDCKMETQTILDKPAGSIKATLVYPKEGVSAVGKTLSFYFSYSGGGSGVAPLYANINTSNVIEFESTYSLSDLNIGWRSFTAGFPGSDGKALKKPGTNSDLVEYFGLLFETQIQLSSTDEDGAYQLATISDDGSIVEYFDEVAQRWNRLLGNDGLHPPAMECAPRTLHLTKGGKPIPIRIQYHQGPKYLIAMDLVWRRVNEKCSTDPSAKGCVDSYCKKVGSSNFYTSSEGALFNTEFAKKWKALRSANYTNP